MTRKQLIQPLFFLLVAALWLGVDLFPAEGWALGGADMQGLFYPWWEYVRNSLFKSHIPFWDPRHFAGTPFLHNPQIAFFYPLTWLVFALPINIGISFFYMVHLLLAGWGMAKLLDELCAKSQYEVTLWGMRVGSMAAGLTFMLGGFFATRIYAGHVGFLATHIWLPWLLVATARGLGQKKWCYIAPTAGFWALAILAGHTTTLLYLGMIWGLFVIWFVMLDHGRNLWFSVRFSAAGLLLGVWVSAVQLLPTLQLIGYSGRLSQGGYAFATRFSLPWGQLISLVIPEWFGEPTQIGYWGGENFEELTAYPGIFGAVALIISIVTWRRNVWRSWNTFFVGLAVVGVLIAVGSNGFLYRVLYTLFPPFRVMRAPGRALFFVSFGGPVLLGLLLHRVQNRPEWGGRVLRNALVSGGIVWLLLLAGLAGSYFTTTNVDLIGRRWHQLENVAVVGVLFIVATLILRWLLRNSLTLSPKLKRTAFMAILLIIILDAGWFGRKLAVPQPMTPDTLWFEAAQILEGRAVDGRILPWGINIFAQNGAGQVGLTSIFGYNTLENGSITGLAASVPDPRSKGYDVLGVTHVVSESGLEQFTTGERGLVLQSQINTTRVYSRPTALPYARIVSHAEFVDGVEMLYGRLHDPNFDPAESLLLLDSTVCQLPSAPAHGMVEIAERSAGFLSMVVVADQPAFVVVAEANFPGWQATVNGLPVPIERAYGAVQAVCVPAGVSEVVLAFRPTVFVWGGGLSLVGLFLVCLVGYRRRK